MSSAQNYSTFTNGFVIGTFCLVVSCTTLLKDQTDPIESGKQVVTDSQEDSISEAQSHSDSSRDAVYEIERQILQDPVGINTPEEHIAPGSSRKTEESGNQKEMLRIVEAPEPIIPAPPKLMSPEADKIPSLTEKIKKTPGGPPGGDQKSMAKQDSAKKAAPLPVVVPPGKLMKSEEVESNSKGPIKVEDNDIVRIIEAKGRDVDVTAVGGLIIIKGECGKLTLKGAKNRVQCELVREVEVVGDENTLIVLSIVSGTISGNRNLVLWREQAGGVDPKLISKGDNEIKQLE